MPASIKLLLDGIIDYAGTFPPASLPLQEALSSYTAARRSAENWLLGRLVLPAGSLDEFDRLVRAADLAGIAPLTVTVILGGDTSTQGQQLDAVMAFNERLGGTAVVESVEFPPLSPSNIRQTKPRLPGALEPFFEVPVDAELERRLGAIAVVGGSAKVRTGGVTPGAFPGPEDLARFIVGCDDAGIAFKATAGLHHAVRGNYRLTYEAGSPETFPSRTCRTEFFGAARRKSHRELASRSAIKSSTSCDATTWGGWTGFLTHFVRPPAPRRSTA
jgi:hypothetical protein